MRGHAPWTWLTDGTSRLRGMLMAARTHARQHWLFAIVFCAGLVLRIVTQVAYSPALVYIDTYRYLHGDSSLDPLGYLALLWPLQRAGGLAAVAAVQHLLGLGMAVTLYAVLLRRGMWRWAAALATAPVLLDAYQLQSEQTIMPDVLFEALIVAGLALLLWRRIPAVWQVGLAAWPWAWPLTSGRSVSSWSSRCCSSCWPAGYGGGGWPRARCSPSVPPSRCCCTWWFSSR